MRAGIRSHRDITSFDIETDVCVIGLGAAGAAAAIDARAAGADVVVLERASGGGGTSALSGGVLYLGGGTSLQTACGFEDSPEDMYQYLMASVGEVPDEPKIRRYCDGSVEHFEWVKAQGVPYKETYYPGISGEPPTDDGLVYSGAETTSPFCDIARPAPRGHVGAKTHQTGPLLMQHLCASTERSGARVLGDRRVTELVLDDDGVVVGVVAEHFGEPLAIRARGGVVIATGGFVLNDEMLQQYVPRALRCKLRVAGDGDDGSGIRLGVAAGAATLHMEKASISLPVTQPWGLKRGVMVNGRGQRFINEDTYYGRLGERALFHEDGRAFLIVDDDIFEEPAYCKEIAAVGESFEELERELSLPPGSLDATMAVYNRHAADGTDPAFGKRSEYLQPLLKAPFGAIDCTTENCLYAAFTLGGMVTDVEARVLGPQGDVIPGLYAAGRSSAGVCAGDYSSGLSLGDATFFGRIAGRNAAAGNA